MASNENDNQGQPIPTSDHIELEIVATRLKKGGAMVTSFINGKVNTTSVENDNNFEQMLTFIMTPEAEFKRTYH